MGSVYNYYSTVQSLLTQVTSCRMREFAKCQTDEERVAFVNGLEGVEDAFMVKPLFQAKCASDSEKWRQRGNQSYQHGHLKDALTSYNMSVILAEKRTGEQSALAIANRSAVFWQLDKIDECLLDIQLAIDSGYPAELKYKLLDRKGRCYLKIGRMKEARNAFNKALQHVEKVQFEGTKKADIQKHIGEELEKCLKSSKEPAKQKIEAASEVCVPTIESSEKSVRYLSASSCVDVKYNSTKGRYMVAAKDVRIGDVIMVEKPYTCVLGKDFYESHCYHCLQATDRPVGCQSCARVRYCSGRCARQSWASFHQWECPFLDLLTTSGTGPMAHLALAIVFHTGLSKILHHKRNPKPSYVHSGTSLFTDSGGVYMTGFIGVNNLVPNSNHRSHNDLLQYTILAVFLQQILWDTGFLDHAKIKDNDKAEVIKYVGGLLLRLLQIVACNGVEVMRLNSAANLLKCPPSSIALAIYPTVSLLNHSCDPNLEVIFYGNTCTVRALKPSPRGHELNIDYGYIYYLTTRKRRQLALKAQYFFSCQCHACVGNWGLKTSLPTGIASLKCTKCGHLLTSHGDPTHATCKHCGLTHNMLSYYETLLDSSKEYEEAQRQAMSFNFTKCLPALREHLMAMHTHVHQPWKEYAECISLIKQCYRALGNKDEKLKKLVNL